ncbi:Cof-type HAD-IIB family hydrolase [Lacticaseibacillus zhaodongensis]|uniref:Cof-type HAD-IIB family hydrolase n=1 Tax=Lacticaseibacillus zhaodongensis TaxID=2668065 RepID=UPI0012D2D5EE|nr:Cof-type HAD-IIB family hydrolase [Lacticaseibacillus zhaodongensis]
MSANKLVVFDIDGTLVNRAKHILPSSLAAIKQLQQQGVHVAIATGRNYQMAKAVIQAAGIHDYVLCTGSAVYIDDQVRARRTLDRKEIADLNLFTRSIGTNFLAEATSGLYADHLPDPVMEQLMAECKTTAVARPGYALTNPIVQGLALLTSAQEAQVPRYQHLRFKRFGPAGVDVLPADGSKARGIKRLADELDVQQQNIVAFGDNQNDKEMLRAAGIGIAMGHADADVRAAADWVTADSESDGIELGLRHIGWLK